MPGDFRISRSAEFSKCLCRVALLDLYCYARAGAQLCHHIIILRHYTFIDFIEFFNISPIQIEHLYR